MNNFYCLLITLLLCSAINTNAQKTVDSIAKPTTISKGHAFRLFFQAGKVIPTNDFVKGNNPTNNPLESYEAMSLQFGWQTYGKKTWQQIYGFPYVGVGFYMVNFSRPKDLGTPAGFYGFLTGPVKRWEKLSINYQSAIGVMFGWVPYNEVSNPYQIAIGAHNTVKLNAGISIHYLLSKYFELDAGVTFTHFSNGSMTMPNYGLNMFGPRIGVKYNLRGQPEFIKNTIPKYESRLEWLVELKMAVKQISPDTSDISYSSPYEGADYGIIGISSTINKQISYKSKFGFGFDFIYDGSVNVRQDVESGEEEDTHANFSQKLAFGIFPSYELVVHNLSLIVQPGFYLYKKKIGDQPKIFYQRIGLKYHIIKNFYAGVNIQAYNFKVADYVEWVLGYRILWKKQ